MPPRTLSLVIFDSAEAEWLIPAASTLALAFDAHTTVLHPFTHVVFFDGVGTAPMVFATFQEWEQDESDKIRDMVDDHARKNGLQMDFRRQTALYGNEAFLLSAARGADLVVMGSNGAGTRSPDDQGLAERLIRNLGRPVLVLPPGVLLSGPAAQIAIGWSDTREATRAAHDALDIARPGAEIDLVSILARAEDRGPGFDSRDDFAAALDRRGFKVTTTDRMAAVENRGEELLRAARERKADLLVTGAFGHSQFYDFMVGAVTGHLLKAATVPLLLSR